MKRPAAPGAPTSGAPGARFVMRAPVVPGYDGATPAATPHRGTQPRCVPGIGRTAT